VGSAAVGSAAVGSAAVLAGVVGAGEVVVRPAPGERGLVVGALVDGVARGATCFAVVPPAESAVGDPGAVDPAPVVARDVPVRPGS
jgi:hypothetical protein